MDSQIRKISRQLREIRASKPETIRRRVLEIIRDFVASDVGLFVKCVQIQDDTPYFTGVVCTGDSHIRDELLEYAEQPAFATPWLPPHLASDEVNTFIRVHDHYEQHYLRSFRRLRKLYEDLGVHDQLRAVFTDENQLIGWLGLLRCDPDSPFTRTHQHLLDGVISPIKTVLRRAEALENEAINAHQCAVYRPNGQTEYHSSCLQDWLTPKRRDHLRARIRSIHLKDEEHHAEIFDSARIDLLRLQSSTDEIRYLVSINHPKPVTIDPCYWLTERQREVARYVMSGATSPEIAEELHVSVETVKSHIKNIFQRLDISSRAELAATLSASSTDIDVP